MSDVSASPRSEGDAGRAPVSGPSELQPDRWLELLTGVGSSKPTFYAEWRRKSRGLDRALEVSKAISMALHTNRSLPTLCRAALQAVGPHFGASHAAMVFTGRHIFAERLPEVIAWPEGGDTSRRPAGPSPGLRTVAGWAMARGEVVLVGGRKAAAGELLTRVGVPMRAVGEPVGSLVLTLPEATLDDSDLAVLKALACEIAVAIENACLYQENERLGDRLTAVWAEATRQVQELEERNRQQQRARQRLVESRRHQLIVRERNRIARELHDTVAQYLVSIGMNLEWCRQQQEIPEAVRERTSVSKELARSALVHIRSTIFELGSLDGVRSGLVLALGDLADGFGAMARLDVRVRTRGRPGPMPLSVENALFRIAQEAMWNVAKHAGASHAWIDLERRANELRLSVGDDGTGIAGAIRHHLEQASGRRPRHHRGLADIRERADEVHGTVRLTRRRGGGVRLAVTVPLDEARTDAGQ